MESTMNAMTEPTTTPAPVSLPALRETVSAEEVAQLLQDCGFRANISYQGPAPVISSAVQGVGFSVIFGSATALPGRFADFSFLCWINVQGDLPQHVVEHWNQSKRFGRLFAQHGRDGAGRSLVMMMDVLIAGGVSERHLRAQCELWDRMTRDLVLHLKQPAAAA
jgi:hypothetical protein